MARKRNASKVTPRRPSRRVSISLSTLLGVHNSDPPNTSAGPPETVAKNTASSKTPEKGGSSRHSVIRLKELTEESVGNDTGNDLTESIEEDVTHVQSAPKQEIEPDPPQQQISVEARSALPIPVETYDNAVYQNNKETAVMNPLMNNKETTVINPLMTANSLSRIQNSEPVGHLYSDQSVDSPNRNIIEEEERKAYDAAQEDTAVPSNSKINVFKKQPTMVLQHYSGSSIKEEASKFKVNIVDETIELPSNTPKNRATRNIDDNDAFQVEEKLLEKIELQKELADLKQQIQLLNSKIDAAGIGNRNSNHKTNEQDLVEASRQSLPSSLGNTANTEQSGLPSKISTLKKHNAPVNSENSMDLLRPIRPGGDKSRSKVGVRRKVGGFFQQHVSEETSLAEGTESTFTSKVVNKIASLDEINEESLVHLKSIHLPKFQNTHDRRESSTIEHSDSTIMKQNKLGSAYPPAVNVDPKIQSINSAMMRSQNFIDKMEGKLSSSSDPANRHNDDGKNESRNNALSNTVKIDATNLDDQVERILRNRRKRYERKELNNKIENVSEITPKNVLPSSPGRRIHIKRSGSIIIGEKKSNLNDPIIADTQNKLFEDDLSAALQYHVKSSPTATSNASHPSGPFVANTKFGCVDFSNPGTNVQSKKNTTETTMGMYSYQMRRALPVLGLSNDMQVKPVHELIDPILKGDELLCLVKSQRQNGDPTWISTQCTFWLAPNLGELQWRENSSGNGGTIPLEKVTSVEKASSFNMSNYHLNRSSRIIDNSKVFILSVLSPDDIPLVLHLAAPTESSRDDWWGGLLYCRSIVCYAAVKRKYKLKPHF